MRESSEATRVRLTLMNEAVSICRSINDMTELWKDSGLAWNTDITSKFHVMSILAKDVTRYLEAERAKDVTNMNEDAHIDTVVSIIIHELGLHDKVFDADAFLRDHDAIDDDELEEALSRINNHTDYKVVRPTICIVHDGNVAYERKFRLVVRSNKSNEEVFDYACKMLMLHE